MASQTSADSSSSSGSSGSSDSGLAAASMNMADKLNNNNNSTSDGGVWVGAALESKQLSAQRLLAQLSVAGATGGAPSLAKLRLAIVAAADAQMTAADSVDLREAQALAAKLTADKVLSSEAAVALADAIRCRALPALRLALQRAALCGLGSGEAQVRAATDLLLLLEERGTAMAEARRELRAALNGLGGGGTAALEQCYNAAKAAGLTSKACPLMAKARQVLMGEEWRERQRATAVRAKAGPPGLLDPKVQKAPAKRQRALRTAIRTASGTL